MYSEEITIEQEKGIEDKLMGLQGERHEIFLALPLSQ